MEELKVFNIHGKDILCHLEDRALTRLHFFYAYGEITISYPPRYNLNKLQSDLERAFTPSKIKKFSSDFLIGENYIYILGEKHRLLRSTYYGEIAKEDIIYISRDKMISRLKALAQDIIEKRVRYYEKVMNTDVHTIKIGDGYTTKGKNYIRKKKLIFDYRLIHFSNEIIDSVVVHELAHDFVPNHSEDFYAVVERYLPDYHELHNKLNYGVKK